MVTRTTLKATLGRMPVQQGVRASGGKETRERAHSSSVLPSKAQSFALKREHRRQVRRQGREQRPVRVEQGLPQLKIHQPEVHQRVREIAVHIPWYGFRTQVRLAKDSGVSAAVISRLIRGESQPTLRVSLRVTEALARRLGKPLDVREVFSTDGRYPTPSVCDLTGCRSCLPAEFYDREENLRPEFQGVKAGQWSQLQVEGKEVA